MLQLNQTKSEKKLPRSKSELAQYYDVSLSTLYRWMLKNDLYNNLKIEKTARTLTPKQIESVITFFG